MGDKTRAAAGASIAKPGLGLAVSALTAGDQRVNGMESDWWGFPEQKPQHPHQGLTVGERDPLGSLIERSSGQT